VNTFLVFLAIQCIPPLFKEIGDEIPLTKAQMGFIMGIITIPSIVFSPVGGAITDRIGSRWAFGVSVLIVAIAGGMRATVSGYYGLVVFMFLLGIGLSALGPNLPKALGMWFPPKEFAMANGICMVSMPLALTLGMGASAGVLSPALGGWRNVMVTIGIITAVTSILWMALFREGEVPGHADKKPSIINNFKSVFKIKEVWWATGFYAIGTLGIMSLFAHLPASLAERGMTRAMAGVFVAILTASNAVFKIVGGTLSDRMGKRKPFLFFSNLVLGLCTVFGFSFLTGVPLIVALIIGGAAMGSIAPIFTVTLVEIKEIGPALAGTTIGVIFMIGNVFAFAGPVLSGKIMDVANAQWPGFLFIGLSFIIASFFILPVRETGQKQKKVAGSAVSSTAAEV
jgi:cyanate permease